MKDKDKTTNFGARAGTVTVVFGIQKLCGVIDWSWWWVVSPVGAMVVIALCGLIWKAVLEVMEESKIEEA
jgi:hypothetical protein